jgi:hypothetical protein
MRYGKRWCRIKSLLAPELPSNTPFQPTPLLVNKIRPILNEA